MAGTFGTGGLLESAGVTALKESGEFAAEGAIDQIVKGAKIAVNEAKTLRPVGPEITKALQAADSTLPDLVGRAKAALGPLDLSESFGEPSVREALESKGFDEKELDRLANASSIAKQVRTGFKPIEDALRKEGVDPTLFSRAQDFLYKHGLSESDVLEGNALQRGTFHILRKAVPDMTVAGTVRAAKTADQLVSAGFTLQQLQIASQLSPRFFDALKNGDYDHAWEYGTEAVVSGGFGLLGANHALHSAGELFKPLIENDKFRPNDEWLSAARFIRERDAQHEIASSTAAKLDREVRSMLGFKDAGPFGKSKDRAAEESLSLATIFHHIVTGGDRIKAAQWYNSLAEASGSADYLPIRTGQINVESEPGAPGQGKIDLSSLSPDQRSDYHAAKMNIVLRALKDSGINVVGGTTGHGFWGGDSSPVTGFRIRGGPAEIERAAQIAHAVVGDQEAIGRTVPDSSSTVPTEANEMAFSLPERLTKDQAIAVGRALEDTNATVFPDMSDPRVIRVINYAWGEIGDEANQAAYRDKIEKAIRGALPGVEPSRISLGKTETGLTETPGDLDITNPVIARAKNEIDRLNVGMGVQDDPRNPFAARTPEAVEAARQKFFKEYKTLLDEGLSRDTLDKMSPSSPYPGVALFDARTYVVFKSALEAVLGNKAPQVATSEWEGVHLQPGAVNATMRYLSAFANKLQPEVGARVMKLVELLGLSRDPEGHLILLTENYTPDTLAEELSHRWIDNNNLFSNDAVRTLSQDPEFAQEIDRLRKIGYGKLPTDRENIEELSHELISKALAGDSGMRFAPERQRQIVSRVLSEVKKSHPQALEEVPFGHGNVEDILKPYRRPYGTGQFEGVNEGDGSGNEPGGFGYIDAGDQGGEAGHLSRANWDEVARDLDEEERARYKTDKQKGALVAAINQLPSEAEYEAAARAGDVQKFWYERSAKIYDALHRSNPELFKLEDRDRFMNMVSATSPRQPVQKNLLMALHVWGKWNQYGRPTDVEWRDPENFTGGVKSKNSKLYRILSSAVDIRSRLLNTIRALQDQPLSGPKVNAFGPNLALRAWKVTNDTWMRVFAGLNNSQLSSKFFQDAMSAAVRNAGTKLGMTPMQAQASIWSFIKTLGDVSEGKSPDFPAEVLKSGLFTQALIADHSFDFADLLMHDQEIRSAVKDIGGDLDAIDDYLAGNLEPKLQPRTTPESATGLLGAAQRIQSAISSGLNSQEIEGTLFDTAAHLRRADQEPPVWYLKSERAIKDKITTPMSSARAGNILRNEGVSNDEMKWSGIDEYLKAKDKIEPDKLRRFVARNAVRIEEVSKGALPPGAWKPISGEAERRPMYESLVIPGGKNYREILFTVPKIGESTAPKYILRDEHGDYVSTKEGVPTQDQLDAAQRMGWKIEPFMGEVLDETKRFQSSHWDEPNVLAHVRMNDRITPDGRKLLHLEEVQSDWHQIGRRYGYWTESDAREYEDVRAKISEMEGSSLGSVDSLTKDWSPEKAEEYKTARSREEELRLKREKAVPEGPLSEKWHDAVLRRMVKYAADHGYDGVSWTGGEDQIQRSDLQAHIENIAVTPHEVDPVNEPRGVVLLPKHPGSDLVRLVVDKNGRVISTLDKTQRSKQFVGRDMADIVGSAISDKIMGAKENTALSGEDLRVGGEGLKPFYDKTIPDYLNKFAKKFAGSPKVSTAEIAASFVEPNDVWSFATKRSAFGKKDLYLHVSENGWWDVRENPKPEDSDKSYHIADDKGGRVASGFDALERDKQKEVQYLPISDAMRESLAGGVAMFKKVATHDPAKVTKEILDGVRKLDLNSKMGAPNSAALVDANGKTVVGKYHYELRPELGPPEGEKYGLYSWETPFLDKGGIKIRVEKGELAIGFGRPDAKTIQRVRTIAQEFPSAKLALEGPDQGPDKFLALGNLSSVLEQLDRYERGDRRAAPQYGSVSYFRNQFKRISDHGPDVNRMIDTQNFTKTPVEYQKRMLSSLARVARGELSPDELKAAQRLRSEDATNYQIGSANDILRHFIDDHLTRIYKDSNPGGKVVSAMAKNGKFATNVSWARHRVYDTHLTALLKSPQEIAMDPIMAVAQGRDSIIKAAANRQLIDNLRDNFTRASDGRPAVVLSGTGKAIQGDNGEDPRTLVYPNRLRKLNISDSAVQTMTANGDLDRFLKDGTVVKITPRITPQNLPDYISRLEAKAGRTDAQYDEVGNNKLRTDIMMMKSILANKDWGRLEQYNADQKPIYAFDPQDYLSLDHPAFRGWNFVTHDPSGNPVLADSEIKVHPEFAQYLKDRLGLEKGALSQNPIGKALLGTTSVLKHTLLSLSPFHAMQIALRGVMTGVSPFTLEAPDLEHGARVDPSNPYSPTKLKMMAEHGYTTGTDYRAMAEHSEGVSSGGGLMAKIPGIGKYIGRSMNWYNDFLFKRFIPAIKATAAEKLFDDYRAKYPEWTTDKVARAAALHANESFGGINWRAMGRSATTQEWGRILALAPDWLESEMRSGARLFNGEEGGVGRAQFAKMALGLWGIARVLNYLTTGQAHPEAPFGVAYKDKEGKEVIYGIRTLPTDLLHAATDPVNFMKGRLSPTVSGLVQTVTGRDRFGRKLSPEDLWIDTFRNMAPIPLQAVGQAISGTGPEIGNVGQLAKGAGLTAQTYQTPAEKLAADLSRNHNEDGPVDPVSQARHRRVMDLEDQVRAGEVSWPDVYRLAYQTDQITPAELKKIQNNVKATEGMDPQMSLLYSRMARLPAPEFLQVWDQLGITEKGRLVPLARKVFLRYINKSKKDMTPIERQKDPTFARIMRVLPEAEQQAVAAAR
jgi:hypothetical protein